MKKEQFLIQEPTSSNNVWGQWLKHKIRDYMVLEALFLIILIIILINSFRSFSQHHETHALISNLQRQLDELQKAVIGNNVTDVKLQEDKKLDETFKEMLKDIRNKPTRPTVVVEKATDKSHEDIQKAPKSQKGAPTPSSVQFNAASLIAGATIDTSRSSSSSLNRLFRFDQSSLVLVDRPKPPVGKAWCSDEKEPILTVNLAKYVNPTAVSYEHSPWKQSPPDGTPKFYDVVSCLDYYCEKTEPLVSNCEYAPSGFWRNNQERICRIPFNSTRAPIGKVQFHFRKNYGNSEMTCASLVRVYSESNETAKVNKLSLDNAEICSSLNYNYHHSPLTYNLFNFKDCKNLHSKGCCTECPECCEECDIQDINFNVMFPFIFVSICLMIIIFMTIGFHFGWIK